MFKSHAPLALAALFALSPPALAQAPRPLSAAGRSVVYAPHGIVATSQPLASSAGLRCCERAAMPSTLPSPLPR